MSYEVSGYRDSYVYDGFVVPDDEVEYEEEAEGDLENPIPEKRRKRFFDKPYFFELTSGSEVVGREEEAKKIIEMINQPNGMHPLLLAPVGRGKTAIVQKIAHLSQTAMQQVMGPRRAFCLDGLKLVAAYQGDELSPSGAAMIQAQLKQLNFQSENPPILYIRDIDVLLEPCDLTEFVLHLVTNRWPIIASISGNPKSEKVSQAIERLVERRFQRFSISELGEQEETKRAMRQLALDTFRAPITITKRAVRTAVRLAKEHLPNLRAVDLIYRCANRLSINNKPLNITREVIANYVSSLTSIPAEDLQADAIFQIERLKTRLKQQIVGQDEAMEVICNRIANLKQGYVDNSKPAAKFLCLGPTGVGKTLTAKMLAKLLFHTEQAFFSISGPEYKEEHTTSRLVGSPPGYVGNHAGGQLTEFLQKNPHSVILFDELEKAHEEVRLLLMGALEDGKIDDRRGFSVDCTKAIFIFTTNLEKQTLFEELKKEFVNRFTDIITYNPLQESVVEDVINVQLNRIKARVKDKGVDLFWTKELLQHLKHVNYDPELGMRNLCQTVDQLIVSKLSSTEREYGEKLKGEIVLNALNNQIVVGRKK